MKEEIKSARGVYYDLNLSPYEYIDDFGIVYKFSSQKKLDMFIERIKQREEKCLKEIDSLKKIGYDVNSTYFQNIKFFPKYVYNEMKYK